MSYQSVAVVLRDMWREYPKAIAIDGGGLDVQFWPTDHPPMDLSRRWREEAIRFDSIDEDDFVRRVNEMPGAPLNLKSAGVGDKEMGMSHMEAARVALSLARRHAPDRPASFADTGTDSAHGVAKTHEFVLCLASDPIDDASAAELASAVQEPMIAPADPAYTCATGACRLAHPLDVERFPEEEECLAALHAKLVVEPQALCRIHGIFNHGEIINGHTRGGTFVYRLLREDPNAVADLVPDAIEMLGVFNNEAQDTPHQLWTYFLRTGKREYFLSAEAHSRHIADVDIVHCHPSEQWRVGLIHYHNVTNWSGGTSPSHTLVSGLMLAYYLTGNRRILDVGREVADRHVRCREKCGVISNRDLPLHREFTGPLSAVLEMYQATWDERYGELARRSLGWLREAIRPDGNLPVSVYTRGEQGDEVWADGLDNKRDYPGGMLCHVLHDACRLFGWDWLKNWTLRLADSITYDTLCDNYVHIDEVPVVPPGTPVAPSGKYKIDDNWYWGGWDPNDHLDPIVALAFRLSGDLKYAAYLKHRLDIFPGRARDACELHEGEAFEMVHHCGYAIPAAMSAVASADPAALAAAEAEWRSQRTRRGHPVFEGDRRRYNEYGSVAGEPGDLSLPVRDFTPQFVSRIWRVPGNGLSPRVS